MKNFARPLAILALLASGSSFAQQTLLEDINVTATVTAACSALTATDVDFGAAAAADVTDDATSTISVTCDTGTAYTVELDYGITPQGTKQRVLTGALGAAGEQMLYDIYQPGGFITPWGTIAEGEEYSGAGNGNAQDLIANFRLQRTSGSSPGTYTDLVGVTLNF